MCTHFSRHFYSNENGEAHLMSQDLNKQKRTRSIHSITISNDRPMPEHWHCQKYISFFSYTFGALFFRQRSLIHFPSTLFFLYSDITLCLKNAFTKWYGEVNTTWIKGEGHRVNKRKETLVQIDLFHRNAYITRTVL